MSIKSFRTALNEAMRQEMERDPTVIALGEDIAGGMGAQGQQDAWGDVLGASKGLLGEFGRNRIFDTPISESAFIGAAAGAAVAGLRPIVQLMFVDFFGVCGDQIFNQMAKFRYMFGGKATTPVVVRTLFGAGTRAACQHSQCLYPIFTHIPGLKVVIPSSPYEAKGLMIQAIRDDDPVIFFEHKAMYDDMGEAPDEPYTIAFGEANMIRTGDDASIVATGRMVKHAREAAIALEQSGVACDLIDLRTTSPLDTKTLLDSVRKTALRPGCRHLGAGGAGSLRFPQGPDPDGHSAAHARPLRAGTRGRIHSVARPDRGCRPRTAGAAGMNANITAVTVPKLGLTMKEGTIAAWHVEQGSTVSVGQPLFDVETEKVTNECTSHRAGILRRQVAPAGTTLPVGSLVAVIAPAQVPDAAIDEFVSGFEPEKQA